MHRSPETNPTDVSTKKAPVADKAQQWLLLGATFLGSFLLFQVQPLIGKQILPWLGGTAAVWTVCLLFFQTMLFAGYAYAHWTTARMKIKRQLILHGLLIIAAVAALPIIPNPVWKSTVTSEPTSAVLKILTATVGLPFLLLATTAPLIQRWWALLETASPYRLYALSNVGSLLALLTYSFVFERIMGTTLQAYAWSALFLAQALLLLGCIIVVWRKVHASPSLDLFSGSQPAAGLEQNRGTTKAESSKGKGRAKGQPAASLVPPADARPTWTDRAIWLFLSALGTTVLMGVSNFLCQDISSVPFLWIAPLTLYLLSFILCFGQSNWYQRKWFVPLMLLSTYATAFVHINVTVITLFPLLLGTLVGLFFVCMVCHGELERSKPAAQHLTEFYLYISAGGMLGGIFVGIIAPLIFTEYYELPLAMIASLLVAIALLFRTPTSPLYRGKMIWAWTIVLIGFAIEVGLWSQSLVIRHAPMFSVQRNFYGVLKTMMKFPLDADQMPEDEVKPEYISMVNGMTEHGGQYIAEEKQDIPTSYYGRATGIGRAFHLLESRSNKRIGAVGLGTGTVAAYGNQGDYVRFYEINPDVKPLAVAMFAYLSHLNKRGGKYDVIDGDARLALEKEPSQQFDILIIDAFAGDSIPVHLLTREAIVEYQRHLKPDGILAVHVSNRYLDLTRVTRQLARQFNLDLARISTRRIEEERVNGCDWILFAQAGVFPATEDVPFVPAAKLNGPFVTWTDDHSSLLEVLGKAEAPPAKVAPSKK